MGKDTKLYKGEYSYRGDYVNKDTIHLLSKRDV